MDKRDKVEFLLINFFILSGFIIGVVTGWFLNTLVNGAK